MGRAVDEWAVVPDPWAHPHRLSAAWAVVFFGLVSFWTAVALVLWRVT